jgi:DNA-binding transcriptional ArsR family regulator
MGAKKRRHKGSARALSVEKILRSKTRRAVRRSLAELSERPLRGGLPVLRCCPSARFPIARQLE